MLSLQTVCLKKKFGQTEVLKGIDLSLADREQCVVRGASGSGKSTFLHLVAGLDRASSGDIIVDGKALSKLNDDDLAQYRNESVGLVFQFHYLLSSMTCLDNILLPVRIGNKYSLEVEKHVKSLAENLGIKNLLLRYPYQLSGGEQQRVNIVRSLSMKPKLLLCDEPTGNLDSKNSEKVTKLLIDLALEYGATLIVVTHDSGVASHFKKEVIMEDGVLVGVE